MASQAEQWRHGGDDVGRVSRLIRLYPPIKRNGNNAPPHAAALVTGWQANAIYFPPRTTFAAQAYDENRYENDPRQHTAKAIVEIVGYHPQLMDEMLGILQG